MKQKWKKKIKWDKDLIQINNAIDYGIITDRLVTLLYTEQITANTNTNIKGWNGIENIIIIDNKTGNMTTCGTWWASNAWSSTVLEWKKCDADIGLRWANMKPEANKAKMRKTTTAILYSFLWGRHAASTLGSEVDIARWAAIA